MPRPLVLILSVLLLVLATSCSSSSSSTPAAEGDGERYQGRIVSTGQRAGTTAFLTMHVDRLASDGEINELATILSEQGEKAMLDAIAAKESAGWLRTSNSMRYHLRVVRSVDTAGGGRVLVGLTDRPIQFGEVARGTRSQSYPVGMVELVLDADGKGKGKFIPAAQVRFADGTAELVSYGRQPLALVDMEQLY